MQYVKCDSSHHLTRHRRTVCNSNPECLVDVRRQMQSTPAWPPALTLTTGALTLRDNCVAALSAVMCCFGH